MNKPIPATPCAHAGVDVSHRTLEAAVRDHRGSERAAHFDNTATGHRQLIRWLIQGNAAIRVVLEATGVYSLDLALALHAAPQLEVMVVNPRAARKFAEACLQRSRTDTTMAVSLREYAARTPFVPGVPPAPGVRDLRAVARRIAVLTAQCAPRVGRTRLHTTVAVWRHRPRAALAKDRLHLKRPGPP